jgi:phosphatidylglycerophosphate synthase
VIVGIIGILSGVFYALGHVILGGLFIEISSILDGCDGEVAKIKLMESKTGQWIDTVLDQLSYAAFIIGVPIGYLISAGRTTSIVLGVVNLSMYIFCVTWGIYFLSKYADSGTMVSYPSTIDKLVPLDQRYFVYKIVYLVRPLLQREYLAFIVFIASIIGGYILVLCITTLTFVLTTIHIYDDIMMLNRVKESHGNLARKAHIV